MDFYTLGRRDLQALCKKNKIPANITNVAMADALKALELVEGIEELMQQSQSGTEQSSVDSLGMPDVTSPFVPPTAGGRSTRRGNIPKLAPESVNPTTRTRRTARKTQVKDADAIETPAMVPQTNRKKDMMASAPLNMESQLKECADEEKKDVLRTPAAATSRRKKAEQSTVMRSYSTRRSVRLAEKSSVEISNEVAKVGENEEMNLKDGVDNFNELSGLTGGDSSTAMEEKSENKDEFEAVSDQTDTSVVQGESYQKHDTIGEEITIGNYTDNEICDNDRNEVQQNHGSEIEITVEKSTKELKFEEGETTEEDEAAAAAKFVESVILDGGDNFVVDEFYFDNIGSLDDNTKEELRNDIVDGGSKDVTDLNVTLDKLTELTLQQVLTQEADSEFVDHLNHPELQLNEKESNASEKATDLIKLDTIPSGFEGVENEPSEINVLKPEEDEKAAEHCEQIPTKIGICCSNNKENIGSGVKLVVMRDVKMAKKNDDLDDLSVRQLTKMLKEKLEITKKPSKTEIVNEAVMSRTALRAISENRKVDGAGN